MMELLKVRPTTLSGPFVSLVSEARDYSPLAVEWIQNLERAACLYSWQKAELGAFPDGWALVHGKKFSMGRRKMSG